MYIKRTCLYTHCMAAFTTRDHQFLAAVASLGYCNPFLPERMELERAALGREFVPGEVVWSASVTDPDATRANVALVHRKLEGVLETMQSRLAPSSYVHPD